jgi:hypothetical protein
MQDPNIVSSGLSQRTIIEGHEFRIEIYRLETDTTWTLEVVDEDGTSTVWDDQFDTDQAALDEIYSYNPLLFDFVMKRTIRVGGRKLPDTVFGKLPEPVSQACSTVPK